VDFEFHRLSGAKIHTFKKIKKFAESFAWIKKMINFAAIIGYAEPKKRNNLTVNTLL
jgi:hypothetical protein